MRLQRGIIKTQTWRILRRYNEFAELHKCLSISGLELPLPGKRLFGNMRPDFIAERRQALQVYINTVLMNPILASSLPAKRFVDPDSYSQSFHGNYKEIVHIFFIKGLRMTSFLLNFSFFTFF